MPANQLPSTAKWVQLPTGMATAAGQPGIYLPTGPEGACTATWGSQTCMAFCKPGFKRSSSVASFTTSRCSGTQIANGGALEWYEALSQSGRGSP